MKHILTFIVWALLAIIPPRSLAQGGALTPGTLRAVDPDENGHQQPSSWDTAVFFPFLIPNQILKEFKGAWADCSIENFPKLRITLEQVTLVSAVDKATATARFAVSKIGADDAVILDATGELGDAKWNDIGGSGLGNVQFPIRIVSAKLGATWRGRSFMTAEDISKITGDMINQAFDKQLVLELPLPAGFALDLKSTSDLGFETPARGRVNVRVTTPDTQIKRRIKQFATIFRSSGIWICADLSSNEIGDATPKVVTVSSGADDQYEKLGKDPGSARVFVRGTMLADVFNKLGNQTAKIEVLAHTGVLAREEWQDKIHGNGGIQVWLQNDNGSGSLTVTPMAVWKNRQLDVTCNYSAMAQTDLHVHVPVPLSIGGIGTSLGCTGNSKNTVTGSLELKSAANKSATILSLVPEFAAGQNLAVTAKSDGKLKFDFIGGVVSLNVPDIDVIVELPVPQDLLPIMPLLTNEPRPLSLPDSVVTIRKDQPGKKPYWLVVPNEQIIVSDAGLVLGFSFAVSWLTDEECKVEVAAVSDAIDSTARPQLTLGKIAVKIGDRVQVYQAVTATAKELQKAGKNIGPAGKDTEREIARAPRNIERDVGKAVGKAGENNAQNAARWIKKTFGL